MVTEKFPIPSARNTTNSKLDRVYIYMQDANPSMQATGSLLDLTLVTP